MLLCVMLLTTPTPLQVRKCHGAPTKYILALFSLIHFLIPSSSVSMLSGCTRCEAGHYSTNEHGACKACEIGLFSPPGATTCTATCPSGFGGDATNVPIYVNVFFMLDKTDSICDQWVEEIEAAEEYCTFHTDYTIVVYNVNCVLTILIVSFTFYI